VRDAVLAGARDEAAAVVAAARTRADAIVDDARQEVEAAVDVARRRAALAARARADAAIASARREHHTTVLGTEASLRRELQARLRRAVRELVDDPRHPAMLDALTRVARAQLGEDAVVEHDPSGGVVATAGGRRVDYGLDAIADRAFATIEEEVAALWT
jgi:vacuolar-type H+-ATPase subunit E/Vma4